MSEEIKILKLNNVLLNRLPNNFKFEGTLDLTGSSIKELPQGLFIQEDLIIGDSNIEIISKDTIIGGDLIDLFGKIKYIHPSTIIGGAFLVNNKEQYVESENNQYIILDNGKKFYYKNKVYYSHKALGNHNFDRTPFNIYYGYSQNKMAIQWTAEKILYSEIVKNKEEARFKVNYRDALNRGLEQYKGLDIDTPMLGHDILEIYQICTHSCKEVIDEYLEYFNFDLNKKYTLREIGYAIQKFKEIRYAPASEVFMYFFNIPSYKEKGKND